MPIFTRAPFVPPTNRLAGVPLFASPLLGGDAGVSQTVAKMRDLIDQSLRDPAIIRLATDIVRNVPPHDDMGEATAIYDWVQANIRFTKDPIGKEKLYPPTELLNIRAGDCDDITMLMAALLMAIGINARAITVSASDEDPSQFSHIYPEAQIGGQWVPMDAARPDAMFGAMPPMYYRMRAWSLTDGGYQDLNGLGAYPRFRSLGDLSPVDASLISSVASDVAPIISAASGGPYSSFMTKYTPFGQPAGYVAQQQNSSLPLLLLLGLGAFLLLR